MVVTLVAIRSLEAARGKRIQENLAVQCRPVGPIRETVFQYEILPFLQDGRRRIPVEGMLENDNLMIDQPRLFKVNIDLEIRVLGVQIDEGHTVDAGRCIRQRAIDFRAVQSRMS